MPNRGGLIETDSVRHFFDIMETDLFFLYGSFCQMQCCASPAQSARKVGITDKTAVLDIARKTSLETKKDFCGNHCRKSPMRSIDDGGPAALHNASDQARCNPATLYPASKNDH